MPSDPRPPWWLWPNLLSLDAPLVAAVWQRSVNQGAPGSATVTLVCSVWLVYVADRLWDGWRGRREAERHRFVWRHRGWFAGVGGVVLALDIQAAQMLPAWQIRAGCGLLAAVLARWAVVRRGWLKDLATALIFTSAVWRPAGLLSGPAAVFAGLCWWNCRAIDVWETGAPDGWLLPGAGVLACAAAGLGGSTEFVAALAYASLAMGARRMSVDARRVAVDVCLLSPLVLPHAR